MPLVLIGSLAALVLMHRDPPGVLLPGIVKAGPAPLPPLQLTTVGPHLLRGVVVDSTGAPAPDVFISGRIGVRIVGAFTDEQGTFLLEDLPAGELDLLLARSVLPHGSAQLTVPTGSDVRLELPPESEDLPTLPRIERSALEARLELPFGDLPEDYEIAFLPLRTEATGGSSRATAPGLDGAVQRRVDVGPYGKLRVEDLAHGSYLVVVLPPWAKGGSWPHLLERPVEHRGTTGPVKLRAQSGELRGELLDGRGEPVVGAAVHLRSADRPQQVWPLESSSSTGAFRFTDLPGGSYRLAVTAGPASFETLVRVSALRTTRVEVPALELGPR